MATESRAYNKREWSKRKRCLSSSKLRDCSPSRCRTRFSAVYVAIALIWLWQIDGVVPTRCDLVGSVLTLAGMAIIMLQPTRSV
ncbi:hypothetical protein [Dechloromonas sp. CZR5]|uniref:hypothetical protein n=1 Tax=Dechloromonas TaxID=73029 RepID=UPI001CC349BD